MRHGIPFQFQLTDVPFFYNRPSGQKDYFEFFSALSSTWVIFKIWSPKQKLTAL